MGKPDIFVVSGLTYAKLIEGGLGRDVTRIVFVQQHITAYTGCYNLTHRLRQGKRRLKGIQSCIVTGFEAKVCLQSFQSREFTVLIFLAVYVVLPPLVAEAKGRQMVVKTDVINEKKSEMNKF